MPNEGWVSRAIGEPGSHTDIRYNYFEGQWSLWKAENHAAFHVQRMSSGNALESATMSFRDALIQATKATSTAPSAGFLYPNE